MIFAVKKLIIAIDSYNYGLQGGVTNGKVRGM
jgi:hypothetical protein